MAATIRLMRFGKKAYPTYRIVVIDKRKKAVGSYIEKLGFYNPVANPDILEINKERVNYWLKTGAQPSEAIKKLLKKKLKID